MSKLHCKVGDLAITVRAEVPQNLGSIVHIIKPLGLQDWSEFGQVHMWWVECLPNSPYRLHYLHSDGSFTKQRQGPVPDLLLRPIVPPEGFNEVTDWLTLNCDPPADIARGVALYCDYQRALHGSDEK